ncbi:MAG: M48 family metallopeptidase [Gammaproteobacteria bacterium]|nr:M48 family metallopeptidase [Gammaproteobacteria bacterium]
MNFFEHQDRAQRRTRGLLVLFTLAVLAIIAAVNLIVLTLFSQTGGLEEPPGWRDLLSQHAGLLVWTTLLTGGLIGFASLYRTLRLRSGGGTVARELGGTLVDPDTTDPLKRRLRNVVEEIAIAAGVPVPEVYVLDEEAGINAFAAGYTPADAAVAVTRGALESLDRDELQGVIAHEFGHILNGDMRLNIRLIGILFGILVLTVIGRRVLFAMRHSRSNRNGGGIVVLGLALMLVGYIGLFFGRWIQASVSRQREYLADASAVQFTRQPEGIAGALKKIGAASNGSVLMTDSEEVGHMLFAKGLASALFSTHPPLVKRIQAIEPGFDPSEFTAIAVQMHRHAQARQASEEESATREERPRGPGGLPLDPDHLIEQMGQPGVGQILAATLLVAAIPKPLERAAHSGEWAPELICYLLMDPDPTIRETQLLRVAQTLGAESEGQVRTLFGIEPRLAAELRIPLLEISFPALRRRPEEELQKLLALVEDLIQADRQVGVFEYCLARLLASQLEDARYPSQARASGRRGLGDLLDEARNLLTILAYHGHAQDPGAARAALKAGLEVLNLEAPEGETRANDWPERLDAALARLDELRLPDKQQLLRALATTVHHDGQAVTAEQELLRAICAALHMPLPLVESFKESGKRA